MYWQKRLRIVVVDVVVIIIQNKPVCSLSSARLWFLAEVRKIIKAKLFLGCEKGRKRRGGL